MQKYSSKLRNSFSEKGSLRRKFNNNYGMIHLLHSIMSVYAHTLIFHNKQELLACQGIFCNLFSFTLFISESIRISGKEKRPADGGAFGWKMCTKKFYCVMA